MPTGRLDGFVSSAAEANSLLVSSQSTAEQLTQQFAQQGFSQDEMITLSGKTYEANAPVLSLLSCSKFFLLRITNDLLGACLLALGCRCTHHWCCSLQWSHRQVIQLPRLSKRCRSNTWSCLCSSTASSMPTKPGSQHHSWPRPNYPLCHGQQLLQKWGNKQSCIGIRHSHLWRLPNTICLQSQLQWWSFMGAKIWRCSCALVHTQPQACQWWRSPHQLSSGELMVATIETWTWIRKFVFRDSGIMNFSAQSILWIGFSSFLQKIILIIMSESMIPWIGIFLLKFRSILDPTRHGLELFSWEKFWYYLFSDIFFLY